MDEAGSRVCGSVNEKGYFGGIWGAPLYPMGTLRRMCATVPQPSDLPFGVVRAEALMYYMGVNVVQREGNLALGVFVLHFHNGKCHCVADCEMFPIRMRKLHNISIRQT